MQLVLNFDYVLTLLLEIFVVVLVLMVFLIKDILFKKVAGILLVGSAFFKLVIMFGLLVLNILFKYLINFYGIIPV